MRAGRTLPGLTALLVAASACSVIQDAAPLSPAVTTVVVQSSLTPPTTTSTTQPFTFAPNKPVQTVRPSDGISVEDGKVLVLPTPSGFVAEPVHPTTDIGGVHGSHVVYRNPSTGQVFVIGELRGGPVATRLRNPQAYGYKPLAGVRVMGAQVYVKTYGNPQTDNWGSIEVAWSLTPDEVLAVNGRMTVDELIAVARAITA